MFFPVFVVIKTMIIQLQASGKADFRQTAPDRLLELEPKHTAGPDCMAPERTADCQTARF